MWQKVFYIIPLLLSTNAIKVPVHSNEEPSTDSTPVSNVEPSQPSPTYYIADDANLDSYLIPPDPHKPNEELSGVLITPATYLLPPSSEKQQDFYNPTEPGEQTDWYPIAQDQDEKEKFESSPVIIADDKSPRVKFLKNKRKGKNLNGEGILIPVPSTNLEPPSVSASNDYFQPTPTEELELSAEEVNSPVWKSQPINYQQLYQENKKYPTDVYPLNYQPASPEPTLALHLTPPKEQFGKFKTPTKLYPKKYSAGFKPVPIPIAQFAEDTQVIPTAKPLKYFKPTSSVETEFTDPLDDKKIYLYQTAEQKRKLKGEYQGFQQQPLLPVVATEESFREPAPNEQEASESNYRYPGRNVYPAPLRQAPSASPPRSEDSAAPAPDERTEFRMHGMKGPHSYQFGYDTGKGKNRQFRFEERDNDGLVRGHYGYMDKHGKMRVVNYSAHPQLGFHAEAPVEKD